MSKLYTSYKDSGVEWLGEVPSHWTSSRLGFHSWVRARLGWKGLKAEEYVDDGFPMLATPNIKRFGVDYDSAARITWERFEESPEIKIKCGDVLLAKDGSTLGTIAIVKDNRPATVNGSIAVITAFDTIIADYLFYQLQSSHIRSKIAQVKDGAGVPHLFQDDIRRFQVVLPPISEQRAIAAFLDRETGKIDALVEEQRRLIALLKEKRQAIISHAVTKGLDPAAPMKPSGVDWLGDIPAHWEVERLSRHFRFVKRQDKDALEVLSVYRDFGVILKSSRDDNINKTPEDLSSYQKVEIGDLVVNKMKAWQGSMGISQHRGIISPDYAVFSPNTNSDSNFLNHLLRCHLLPDVYRSISNGIRPDQWRLEPDKFLALMMPLPPREEQSRIAGTLCAEISKTDALVEMAGQAIALLQERRAALISAAVTGKIDVRDEAAAAEAA